MDKLLTPEQAAEALGLTADTIRRMARAGRIAYVKLGGHDRGRMRFRPADLQAFIDSQLVPAQQPSANPLVSQLKRRNRKAS